MKSLYHEGHPKVRHSSKVPYPIINVIHIHRASQFVPFLPRFKGTYPTFSTGREAFPIGEA